MNENKEKVEDNEEINDDSLAFPTATVVREIKKHIDKNKMIKKEVKIGMNKLLEEVVANVSKRMNEFPYAMLDYRMFEEAAKPYKRVQELDKEVERLEAHLNAIIKDAESIKRDLERKFEKTKEV